ncbi:MAG: hypothetical protein EB117_16085 [Betaproteobacteria bacterium]|nr:hypothetical protein [Betaproteobacteria bacterium]
MIDDPLSLVLWSSWLMAAGMYPVGFLFGACSECCNVCNNFTCDGFDLEEAFGGERTTGRFTVCGVTLEDGNLLVPGETRSQNGQNLSKGCRVYGDGIAPNSVITEVEEVQEPPKQPYVLETQGCCEIVYDRKNPSFGIWNGTVTRVTERVNRTEQECEAREAELNSSEVFQSTPPGFTLIKQNTIVSHSWEECVACAGGVVGPRTISGGRQFPSSIVTLRVTISPSPAGAVGNCLSFCGSGSICGVQPPDESYVNDAMFEIESRRRNCLRWVCRCYEGTGKKGDPLFPNASDWYTVASTTVVGGPTTNNRDLDADLTNASGLLGYEYAPTYEQEWLFETLQWAANEGDIKCLIWTFVFYGTSSEPTPTCETGRIGVPKTIEITDDYYSIGWPCDRCQ